MLYKEILKEIDNRKDDFISIRRYLHQYPELSFKETETAKYIANFYKDKDCTVETGIGGNGVKVTIDTNNPGKTIALRADFDALPITEETGLEFASKNSGVMHACGHDAHTAYLLVLADILIKFKNKLNGKIVIIHQPAEEMPPGGAKAMIEDGVLDGVDNVFGIHVMSQFDYGNVYYHHGETQQARAKFTVKIIGKGGHGSSPHESNDAIVAASHLVVALQTIVSRRLSPFETGVVSIGSFEGAGAFNIIKDNVTITGDVRAMSEKTRDKIHEEIETISKGIGEAFKCDIEFEFQNDYPVLYNDFEMTDLVKEALENADTDDIKQVLDCGAVPPSEDFSFYAEKLPSCFFYVGAGSKEAYPHHHHPKFDINEGAILISAKAMAAVVLKYMNID